MRPEGAWARGRACVTQWDCGTVPNAGQCVMCQEGVCVIRVYVYIDRASVGLWRVGEEWPVFGWGEGMRA